MGYISCIGRGTTPPTFHHISIRSMANYVQWSCEQTDTFGGEANYSWVRRGTAFVPQNATRRQIVRSVKATLGLTGIRCRTFDCGDMIELRPVGECTVAFATIRY